MDRLEERLRAFSAESGADADWEDVRRRAGGRLSPRRVSRRHLAVALAAAVVVLASAIGVLIPRGARVDSTRPSGPVGPTSPVGPTGAPGPIRSPAGANPWGKYGKKLTL